MLTWNCEMTHRSAMRSYDTIGSPSLLVWHPPPNPDHSVLIGTGPNTGVPALLNTAKSVFTVSTMWLGPTAALVSGGAEFTVNVPAGPVKPWPMPSKFRSVAGASSVGCETRAPEQRIGTEASDCATMESGGPAQPRGRRRRGGLAADREAVARRRGRSTAGPRRASF